MFAIINASYVLNIMSISMSLQQLVVLTRVSQLFTNLQQSGDG